MGLVNTLLAASAAKVWIYILGGLALALALGVSVIVAMQSTKEKGLSGTIAGSADSFMGKSGTFTKDKLLSRLTVIISVILVVVIAVLTILVAKNV